MGSLSSGFNPPAPASPEEVLDGWYIFNIAAKVVRGQLPALVRANSTDGAIKAELFTLLSAIHDQVVENMVALETQINTLQEKNAAGLTEIATVRTQLSNNVREQDNLRRQITSLKEASAQAAELYSRELAALYQQVQDKGQGQENANLANQTTTMGLRAEAAEAFSGSRMSTDTGGGREKRKFPDQGCPTGLPHWSQVEPDQASTDVHGAGVRESQIPTKLGVENSAYSADVVLHLEEDVKEEE